MSFPIPSAAAITFATTTMIVFTSTSNHVLPPLEISPQLGGYVFPFENKVQL